MTTTTKQTLYNNETGFSKAIQDYYNEGIISFTFGGIKTHLNKNGEEKKDLIKMTKWETINADNFKDFCMIEHKGLAIITGKISGITGIDFDLVDEYNRMLQDYPDLKNHRTIKTKNGFHVYCKYDESVKTTTGALINYNKIDIRNDDAILFASPMSYKLQSGSWAKYVDLGGDILPIPEIILRNLRQNNTSNGSVKSSTSSSVPVTSTKEAVINHQSENVTRDDNDVIPIGMNDDYVLMWNCISHGLLDSKAKPIPESWDDWRDVGFAIKHTGQNENYYKLFDKFSKRN